MPHHIDCIPSLEDIYRLQREAEAADDRFHAAVVSQFGKRNAGDLRYRSDLHNAATRQAANAFVAASEAQHQAWALRLQYVSASAGGI